jgi:hypothetical protein
MTRLVLLRCMSLLLARSYRHHRNELAVTIGGATDMEDLWPRAVSVENDPSETLAVHCGNGFQPLSRFLFQSCLLSVEPI